MHRSVLIVDDFYPDPYAIRQRGEAVGFPPHEGPRTFPGRNSAEPFRPRDLQNVVSQLLGEPLIASPASGSYHGYFRLTLAGEESRYRVHVDPSSLWWVGVVYLTLPEHCQGGTTLYRHRALGLDRTPTEQAALDRLGVASIAELLARDGPHAEPWEAIMTLPMRFNRAVFYRPWMWHSAEPGFGTGFADGRLIQLVAFNRAPPPQA